MFGNSLKITLRHLWRNRLFTILNVLGLSIGISACLIIGRILSFEFNYDNKQVNDNTIYRVVSRFESEGKESGNGGVPVPLAEYIETNIPGAELTVPIFDNWKQSVKIPGGKNKFQTFDSPEKLVSTTGDYFRLISYDWLAGNISKSLDAPGKVVLTKSRAEKYFPGLSPEKVLGKTILYDDTIAVHVSGIVADLDYPNSFVGQEFFAVPETMEMNGWGGVSSNNMLYTKLGPGISQHKVLQQINAISSQKAAQEMEMYNYKRWHELIPLNQVHFATEYVDHSPKASKNILYGLTVIAVFLLLLASINYINLTTAQIPQRAKEIGIRKTLGSSRIHLLGQFLLETFAISLVAVCLSGGITIWALGFFQDLIPEGMDHYRNYQQMILYLAVLILVITIISGLYPGWLIMKVEAVNSMKGQLTSAVPKNGFNFRKGLIVFQFMIAQLFLIGTLIISEQLHFLLNQEMGFNKEAVIMIEVPWNLLELKAYKNRHFTMADELSRQNEIEKVALGNPPMSQSFSSNNFIYTNEKGEKIQRNVFIKNADTALINFYKIPVIAGRQFNPSDTASEYLLNETAARAFGFQSAPDAIGKIIYSTSGAGLPVVGIVKDFHIGPFYQKIEPVIITQNKTNLSTFNIRLSSKDPATWKSSIEKIRLVWNTMYPGQPFDYKFYDSTIQEMYKSELSLSRIINLSTLVALFIGCLGLFGLSTLTSFQRVKEIGIRKVLGATTANIVTLLSKDFVKLVVLAIILASPIAWYAMNQWLLNFAYKIRIEWWVFVSTGLCALLVALLTVGYQSIKAALINPVISLKSE
jgi:ABC-type antimicrobial peptide transport system permease subunit